MEYNEKVILRQYPILKNIVMHCLCFRIIYERRNVLPGDQEFWIITQNAHYQMTIVSWCNIFGSYNNPTHWVNAGFEKEGFKKFLLEYCSIDAKE